MRSTIEPALHDVLGFIPIFGAPSATGLGVFTAGVVLAIMVLPIIASISRDLFLSVPRELKDGALALGATRWEMIRGVVLDSTRAGLAAATILGLSRALGEAIAVTQLIGAGPAQRKPVQHRRLTREPHRRAGHRRGEQQAARRALLLRGDPARDGADRQPRSAVRRAPLRAPPGSGPLMSMSAIDPASPLTSAGGNLRRRRRVDP